MVSRKSRLFVFVLVLAALLAMVPAAAAQRASADCNDFPEVEIGETVSGEINNDDFALGWCIIAQEGDSLLIDMVATSGDLDAYLFLVDPDFEETYAENDNVSRRSTDSQIEYTIEQDGAYIIVATRVDLDSGDTEGEFEMTIGGEGGSSNVGSGLETVSIDSETVTISYPEDWAVNQSQDSDTAITLGSDRSAVRGEPADLEEGQFTVRFEKFSQEVVQAIADGLAENADMQDLAAALGEEGTAYHVIVLETLLMPDASFEDWEEVTVGDFDGVRATFSYGRTDVTAIAYAFEVRGGDFLLVLGHINGSSRDVRDFDEVMTSLVEGVEIARSR
ncbi:MAG: hypothetical protein JNM70_20870 [Anaerolineae bacterium]|nr:hypothetical protein [Anaerolineae bacterium]